MAETSSKKEHQLRMMRESAAKKAEDGLRPRIGVVMASTIAETGTLDPKTNLDAQAKKDAAKPVAKTKAEAPAKAQPTESSVKTSAAKKKPSTKKPIKAKTTDRRKPPARAAVARPKGFVPAQEIADFMARDKGASMEELVERFKIDAHPMRSKIFYVRHKLGYKVERKDGRFHATPPKK